MGNRICLYHVTNSKGGDGCKKGKEKSEPLPAYASVSRLLPDCDEEGCRGDEGKPYADVWVSISFPGEMGADSMWEDIRGFADLRIPADAYIQGGIFEFDLNSFSGYGLEFYGEYFTGSLAGTIDIINDGLEEGEEVQLKIQFSQISICDGEEIYEGEGQEPEPSQ